MSSSAEESEEIPLRWFSPVLSKQVRRPILLSWCPSMDLIAVATTPTVVHVHRLGWQRLLSLNAPSFDMSCFSWYPDGEKS